METFGVWLESEIDRLGVSYEGFGNLLKPKRSYATISRWISGKNAPDANMIPAIAKVLGVPTEEVCRRLGLITTKAPESAKRARLQHRIDGFTDSQLEQLDAVLDAVFGRRSSD